MNHQPTKGNKMNDAIKFYQAARAENMEVGAAITYAVAMTGVHRGQLVDALMR